MHIKGTVKEEFWGKWTVAATVTEETLPLLCLFPALPINPPVAIMRQPYQNTWPGGERGQKPQCLICGLAFCFLLSVSCLGWKLCLRIFCSIWVGSKCLSKSCIKAPSRAAHFDLLVLKSQRDESVHLKSSISQQRHSRYLIKTEMNTLYICVNTKGVAVYIWNK